MDVILNIAELLELNNIKRKSKAKLVNELRSLVADLPSDRPRCPFVTTIHMANSGLIKLAALLHCPKDRKVFRGYSGIKLPGFFYIPNSLGFSGGVEPGFLSTTTIKHVASTYASHGRKAIVLELEVGEVNRGAFVQDVSQVLSAQNHHCKRSCHVSCTC
jgi:hypothetical protein